MAGRPPKQQQTQQAATSAPIATSASPATATPASPSSTTTTVSPPPKEAYLYFIFPDSVSITETAIEQVKNAIRNATLKKLHLVVYSRGGDQYSAVKIIRILRTKFNNIIGIVPRRAMSAATLMLLGTDEIYMSEESQLGPLDLPMEHPIDGSAISALDIANTLNQLSQTTMSNAIGMYEKMRDGDLPNNETIGKSQAMRLALETAVAIVKPIAEQIDPYQRQKALRKLKIAQWYAFDLLRTGMMKGQSSEAWRIASTFVSNFPDHSYAIFREEAGGGLLSLNIKNSVDFPQWNTVCTEADTKLRLATTAVISYIEK